MSLRPLKKIRAGVWESNDGRFQFVDGFQAHAVGSNAECWHIYDQHAEHHEAWGDREPTLGDAVEQVRLYEYRNERVRVLRRRPMSEDRKKEILACFDDTIWMAYYEIVPPSWSTYRRPTVQELGALRRAGLLDHRPRGATVGPGVWAPTEHGLALLLGGTPEDHVTVPAAETDWVRTRST